MTTPDVQHEQDRSLPTARRTVLAGAGAVGAAALLAACSSNGGGTTPSQTSQTTPAGDTPSTAGTGQAQGGSTVLGPTSDVPVGGGKVYAAQKVVVTQPTAGNFKCFTAVCTHAGCTVADVSGGTIHCPCHGSQYHITDGTVAGGPAPLPLAAEKISVSGGQISLEG